MAKKKRFKTRSMSHGEDPLYTSFEIELIYPFGEQTQSQGNSTISTSHVSQVLVDVSFSSRDANLVAISLETANHGRAWMHAPQLVQLT